jgi:hypothetical protein
MWLGSLSQLARLSCIMAMNTSTTFQGLDKVEFLLLALWQNQALKASFVTRGIPAPTITREKALDALSENGGYVDVLCGKIIEIDFSKDMDFTVYDQQGGYLTAEAVITHFRKAQTALDPLLFNIQGLDKADLILAMWEKLEFCDDLRRPVLTRERALTSLIEAGGYVFILCGKVINTDFSSDLVVDGTVYDQHAGAGAMKEIVKNLRSPVFYATLNAVRQRRLQEVVPVKTVKGDGAFSWRCILDSLPDNVCRLLNLVLPSTIDFANGSGADVLPHVNKLRTMAAEITKELRADDSEEWHNIVARSPLTCGLDMWLARMETPVENLTDSREDDGGALAMTMTVRVFHGLGFDLRIITPEGVYEMRNDTSVPIMPRIEVDLASYLRAPM